MHFRKWRLLPAAAALALLLTSLAGASTDTLDRAAVAAHQAGEPSLGEILKKLGYTTDPTGAEVSAPLFVKAHQGRVTYKPIAAFGLPSVCTAGWYRPVVDRPDLHRLWQVGEHNNKRYSPPIVRGGHAQFDPGVEPFGLWVSTAGFKDETVCTQDQLQRFVPRFKPNDRHKAHIYAAARDGRVIPDTYIIGWEYSTNNDDQDMVTLVSNVRPAPPGLP